MDFTLSVLLVLIVVLPASFSDTQRPPHIIFIVADDLGWNDVGFHGSNQIPTPNIDALAYSGLILNNYYVNPVCTPSRSALMTGKYPIHTGMQHRVIYGAEPRGLPLNEKLLPEYLKELGYTNHIVGKWHLGSYKKEYTPLFRGFETHLGLWSGHHDYFDHSAVEWDLWGFDIRRGMDVAWDLHGKYSTDIFTDESVRIIRGHNSSQPLFLYIGHVAVHSANAYNPLPAPDKLVAKFTKINDFNRKKFAAMLTKLDESVGKVVAALQSSKMLKDSLIVFTTDNGGPAAGFNLNAASNWPLRGTKNTLWEGGVRGAGLIWSTQLPLDRHVSKQLMHIADWLPTLISAAQGDTSVLENIDGVDLWESLLSNTPSSRKEVLHNIDDIYGSAALTVGEWKIVKGTTYKGQWDGWYGPSGRPDGHNKPAYNTPMIANSQAGKAVKAAGRPVKLGQILSIRNEAEVKCTNKDSKPCHPLQAPCLFNITDDPCEKNNVADSFPEILAQISEQLSLINETAVPPGNLPMDQRGDPVLWNHTFTNFGDYPEESTIAAES
ncbi:hypothetical protein LSTR_LSTR008562 [Laodelphax striatellus]|uniref:Sulfatase N-terminal domain-containing protein n=1 Tax=Laodelphax striatellus TaxID=195883 RepID=A0A482WVG7_LAOST|nr:hypothetical protein LSTR_LSTR008562 [Laodelphax striatellus]